MDSDAKPSISSRSQRSRSRLANYLRDVADAIERDELETAPWAATLILTGDIRHEVLAVGYGTRSEMPFMNEHNGSQFIDRTDAEKLSSTEPHPSQWYDTPKEE